MTELTPGAYLTCTNGVPTRESLSQELDFKVPTEFADFVRRVFEYSDGSSERCLAAFLATLGIYPNGPDARYSGTPPELFPVGSTGCDGDHYGFLLLAPELDLDDLPLAHYCPMDSDGVGLVGSTAIQGIASLMACHLSYDFIPNEEKELIARVAHMCNIHPVDEPHPAISVPTGWRFLPSSDGVGTLAPADLFDLRPVLEFDQYGPLTPFLGAADDAINRGYFATALHYLREGLWFRWPEKPYDLARRMVDVYHKMNRGKLAAELMRTMNGWAKL